MHIRKPITGNLQRRLRVINVLNHQRPRVIVDIYM